LAFFKRVEAFSKPVIDWHDKIVGLLSFTLIAPQLMAERNSHDFAR